VCWGGTEGAEGVATHALNQPSKGGGRIVGSMGEREMGYQESNIPIQTKGRSLQRQKGSGSLLERKPMGGGDRNRNQVAC